jgi:hypothetical protein
MSEFKDFYEFKVSASNNNAAAVKESVKLNRVLRNKRQSSKFWKMYVSRKIFYSFHTAFLHFILCKCLESQGDEKLLRNSVERVIPNSNPYTSFTLK